MMDLNSSSLDIIDDGSPHSLLEPPSPAYSNVTVRRAFIVWMYCGQANKFKDVCNYYHYLEALEEKLPLDQRATSRHHEFNMFCNPPPASPYLVSQYPKLYSSTPIEPYYIKKLEAIKNEKCIFKLEGFSQIRQKGVTTAEIIEASQIIRKYCKTQLLPLRKFLEEYKEYANKCGLPDTVSNVAAYIKRKMVQAELETVANYPQNFSFLNSTTDELNDSIEELENDDGMRFEEANNLNILLDKTNKLKLQEGNIKDRPDETNNLKLILGVNSEEDKENIRKEKQYNSCADFFKSFNSKQQNVRVNSYSPLTPQIEDFVKLFDQNRQKSRSVESLIQGKTNIVDALSFANQEYFDSSLVKLSELNKLRKI